MKGEMTGKTTRTRLHFNAGGLCGCGEKGFRLPNEWNEKRALPWSSMS